MEQGELEDHPLVAYDLAWMWRELGIEESPIVESVRGQADRRRRTVAIGMNSRSGLEGSGSNP